MGGAVAGLIELNTRPLYSFFGSFQCFGEERNRVLTVVMAELWYWRDARLKLVGVA